MILELEIVESEPLSNNTKNRTPYPSANFLMTN